MKEAIIFIPGIMGSILKDGDKEIWPGNVVELLLPYRHMDALLKPDLTATDVIRNFAFTSQYDDLIKSLNACGFDEGDMGNLKIFPYDWRKDNAIAANALAQTIDYMAKRADDNLSITLLAHSMGGLVCRCYLESGMYKDRPGFPRVKYLITMGTPHRGSPMALSAATGQEKRLFLSADQVRTVANDPNFPSLYQLLPPKSEPFAWNQSLEARFNPEDIYNLELAGKLGLTIANLESANSFHQLLDLNRRPPNVRYFFFAGTRKTTTNSVKISKDGANYKVIKNDCDDAGDGTVPFWSGSVSGIQTEPVGGEHGEIYKNSDLKFVLGTLLGKPNILAARGRNPEISILKKVVNPDDQVQVTIDFPRATTKIEGVLRVFRLADSTGVENTGTNFSETFPITYDGPEIDHLSILLEAPKYIGIYGVIFESGVSAIRSNQTELFVQEV